MMKAAAVAEIGTALVGPMHTPAEVAALVAAGQEAMRDRCHDAAIDPLIDTWGPGADVDAVLAAIHAARLPSAPAALARMIAEAEARGMLKAAEIAREAAEEGHFFEGEWVEPSAAAVADRIRAAAGEGGP